MEPRPGTNSRPWDHHHGHLFYECLESVTSFQIFFYEWELSLKWKGHLNGNDKEVKGKVEICNLSEEHDNMDDVDLVRWLFIFKLYEPTGLRNSKHRLIKESTIKEHLSCTSLFIVWVVE